LYKCGDAKGGGHVAMISCDIVKTYWSFMLNVYLKSEIFPTEKFEEKNPKEQVKD
jgi:hypothetical protein